MCGGVRLRSGFRSQMIPVTNPVIGIFLGSHASVCRRLLLHRSDQGQPLEQIDLDLGVVAGDSDLLHELNGDNRTPRLRQAVCSALTRKGSNGESFDRRMASLDTAQRAAIAYILGELAEQLRAQGLASGFEWNDATDNVAVRALDSFWR